MLEHRWTSLAALPLLLLSAEAPAGTSTSSPPSDVEAFVKALPSPGPRNRPFLEVPAALLAHLSIDATALRGIDPGVVCDPNSRTPSLSTLALGAIGEVQTLCTPAGWSQGMLVLKSGTNYVTTCGDPASPRLTVSADVSAGAQNWHGAIDSAPSTRALSHTCSGWAKVPR
jgi:hypothetical protein